MDKIKNIKRLFQKAAANQGLLLFLAFWSTPLFFINDNTAHTRILRLLILLLLGGWVIATDQLRGRFMQNLGKLSQRLKVILAGILLLMVISTVFSAEQVGLRLFGFAPEYIGLVTWMVFLLIGATLADKLVKYMLSRATLVLTVAILATGLIYNKFYIYYGLRVSGLLFQSTTMGMYAVMSLALGLYSLKSGAKRDKASRILSIACIVLSTLTLVFTQSRIGYVAFVLVVFMWGMHRLKYKGLGTLAVIAVMLVLSSLPYLFGSYFARFRSTNIERSISYRMDLYEISAKDLPKHNILIGNGPGALPTAINNKDTVPDEIARTLEQDNLFASTHDMYFDFAYQFGVLASLGLVTLTLFAYIKNIRGRVNGFLLVIFGVMILNALFNVPSIEFTPLYFITLFALLLPGPRFIAKKHGR